MKTVCKRALMLFLLLTYAIRPLRAGAEVSFVHEVAPILIKRCLGCHSERVNQGGYRAHTFQSLLKPGATGQPPIVPGNPDKSRLFRLLVEKITPLRMPKNDDPLSPAQIQTIRRWIQEGAKFDASAQTAALKSLLGPRQHPAAPVVYRTPVPVMALAFVSGGKEIAVGGYNEVTLWNVETGALTRRIPRLPQRIQALIYRPATNTLLVGGGTPGEYGEVAVVSVATGERLRVLDTFPDMVLALAVSPDGRQIAAGGADASVRVYDAESGKLQWSMGVHSDWVTSLSFSGDGRFLASASRDKTVKIYEAQSGALFTTYSGHNRQIGQYQGQSPVYAVQFVSGTIQALSAGGGHWIQLWNPIKTREETGDAGDMEERFARQGHARYIKHGFGLEVFALTVRDGQIFAAGADGVLKQFRLDDLKEVRTYSGGTDWLFSLDFDPATQRVATGSYNGEIHLWNTQTGQPLRVFAAMPTKK